MLSLHGCTRCRDRASIAENNLTSPNIFWDIFTLEFNCHRDFRSARRSENSERFNLDLYTLWDSLSSGGFCFRKHGSSFKYTSELLRSSSLYRSQFARKPKNPTIVTEALRVNTPLRTRNAVVPFIVRILVWSFSTIMHRQATASRWLSPFRLTKYSTIEFLLPIILCFRAHIEYFKI